MLMYFYGYVITPLAFVGLAELPLAKAQASSVEQVTLSKFTASPTFPTPLFAEYYYGASPDRQPQPKVYDEVLGYTYPLELTNPLTIPTQPDYPIYFPKPIGSFSNGSDIIAYARSQATQILSSSSSNCTKCQMMLNVGKYVAQRVPKLLPDLLVELCQTTGFKSKESCLENYQATTYGYVWTQTLAFGDMLGSDGRYICYYLNSQWCPKWYTLPSNTTGYFGSKPKNITIPKASGKRVKVLHMSDMHLDPRYAVGQEANCSAGMCCRYPTPANNFTKITQPAKTYGNFKCDSPYYLVTAAMSSITSLTGTSFNYLNSSLTDHFAWSIYTGDIEAHDPSTQDSRNLTSYSEYVGAHLLKSYIPGGPVFVALGNHDTCPSNIDATYKFPGNLSQQSSWNFEHVSSLWQHNGWISPRASAQARTHYGAYSINHPKYSKLRIITLNTDFWYRTNFFNYVNTTEPDNSGTLKFLANELADAEVKNERVWIVGHVLTGFDGTNPIPNPTDLFYQIVDRFSPHVIAGVFWGHQHEDMLMVYYSNNGTVRDAAHAQNVGWVGPSLTPLSNLNPGYRMYEVDTGDFSVYNSYTYYTNASTFDTLNPNATGPVFQFEYSARDTYQIGWPLDAPLNATYWHLVTEAMEKNTTLVSLFNNYQGRLSIKSPNCTSAACTQAKICYIRSGSVALGSQCPQGFGSVQSAFTGKNF